MRLSYLLQLGLNLTNRLVLELFDLLERTSDHTQGLRVDPRRRQNLVRLRVLRFQALLDRLELLLQDQVAQTRFPMNIIDDIVELFKQLLLFLLNVLVLLQPNFILPFDFLVLLLSLDNLLLLVGEIGANLVIL